jgi:hypothetical protein
MLWSKAKVPQEPKKGLKFGSWDWITHGTEDEGPKQPRVF